MTGNGRNGKIVILTRLRQELAVWSGNISGEILSFPAVQIFRRVIGDDRRDSGENPPVVDRFRSGGWTVRWLSGGSPVGGWRVRTGRCGASCRWSAVGWCMAGQDAGLSCAGRAVVVRGTWYVRRDQDGCSRYCRGSMVSLSGSGRACTILSRDDGLRSTSGRAVAVLARNTGRRAGWLQVSVPPVGTGYEPSSDGARVHVLWSDAGTRYAPWLSGRWSVHRGTFAVRADSRFGAGGPCRWAVGLGQSTVGPSSHAGANRGGGAAVRSTAVVEMQK